MVSPRSASELMLRYDEPATDWETQALPIGNGVLGAMVFGGVRIERLQFNEKTLWTGGPGSGQGYDFGYRAGPRPDEIAEVRTLIDRDGSMPPAAVAARLGRPQDRLRGLPAIRRPAARGLRRGLAFLHRGPEP